MATEAQKVTWAEVAAPATPAAGKVVTYAKADGLMYSKDDAGAETLMSGGAGGGSVATDAIWDAAGDLAVGTGANTAARLAVGAANTVPKSNGTTLAYAFPPGHEFDYSEITTPVTVSGTAETSAGSTLVITGNAATYDGAPVVLEFFAPAVNPDVTAGNDVRVGLYEGTTFLGRIGLAQAAGTGGSADNRPMTCSYRFTPTAASHTYLIRAMRSGADGTIWCGIAGATNYVPAFMRITKA